MDEALCLGDGSIHFRSMAPLLPAYFRNRSRPPKIPNLCEGDGADGIIDFTWTPSGGNSISPIIVRPSGINSLKLSEHLPVPRDVRIVRLTVLCCGACLDVVLQHLKTPNHG